MYSLPRIAIIACAFATPFSFVRAQWTGATTGLNYTDTANWTGGVINGVFSNNLTVGQTVNLPNASGYTFTTGLTFSYADSFALTLIRGGVAPIALTLGGDITVNVAGSATAQTVALGSASRLANLDLGGVTRTFSVAGASSITTMDSLSVFGSVSNGSLVKTGFGNLNLYGASSVATTVSGGGRLTVGTSGGANGSLTATSSVILSGQNSQLVADSTVLDRINDTVSITLAGGMLHYDVSPVSGRTETVGTVTLTAGRSALGVGRVSASPTSTGTLLITDLVRTDNATVNLQSYSPSTGGAVKLTNDTNIIADLVGGGGADGTKTKSIVPWMTIGTYDVNNSSSTGYSSTGGLVTYDSVNKTLRGLDTTTEYRVDDINNVAAGENHRLSASATLTATKAVNGLFFSSPSTLTLSSGQTLTVTSGAIATGASAVTITGGTLEFGSKTGVFTGRNTSTIASVINGTGGFIAANVGTGLTLSGANTYTGPTIVQGNLFTSNNERIANTSALRVDVSGNFAVGAGNTETVASLAGRGTAYLNSTGARLIIGSGAGTAGAVTFGNGGILAAGDPSGSFLAGQLTLGTAARATNAIFETGSIFNVDLASLTSFDSLAVVNGSANITGGALNVSLVGSFIATDGDSFHILTTTGGGTGNFTTTTAGWSGVWAGNDYVLTYSAIPEPSTYALLASGVVLLIAIRRRRGR